MLTNKFPPTIADIREYAVSVQTGEKRLWSDGWEEVLKAIRRFKTVLCRSLFPIAEDIKLPRIGKYKATRGNKKVGCNNEVARDGSRNHIREQAETVSVLKTTQKVTLKRETENKLKTTPYQSGWKLFTISWKYQIPLTMYICLF